MIYPTFVEKKEKYDAKQRKYNTTNQSFKTNLDWLRSICKIPS